MKILHFLNDFWPSLENRRRQFLVMDRVSLCQLRVSHDDSQRVVDVVLQSTKTLADGLQVLLGHLKWRVRHRSVILKTN